ncbi:hypothetical protein ACXIUT_24675 [Achromobacter denitrificans]
MSALAMKGFADLIDREAMQLQWLVECFLMEEAALLDHWKLNEWLDLFTDDGRYEIPTTDRPDQPSRLVVAGRLAAGAESGQLAAALVLEDYDWHTTSVAATGRVLYEYDYVARFMGEGSLPAVQAVMARYPALRLAGAFDCSVSLAGR